jgi:hypothetical protein
MVHVVEYAFLESQYGLRAQCRVNHKVLLKRHWKKASASVSFFAMSI